MNSVNTKLDWTGKCPVKTYPPYDHLPHDPDHILSDWLNSIVISPISADYWRCPPGWKRPKYVNPFTTLYYFESGRGMCWINEKSNCFEFIPHSLLVCSEGVIREINPYPGENVNLYIIRCNCRLYESIDFINFLGLNGVFLDSEEKILYSCVKYLCYIYALQPPGMFRSMEADIFKIIAMIFRHYGNRIKISGKISKNLVKLVPIIQWLDKNYWRKDIKIDLLASKLYMSEVYFRKLFTKVLTISPINYLQRLRINKACMLLTQTNHNMKTIADMCGFANQKYFFRVFRKWTGTTPSEHKIDINSYHDLRSRLKPKT